MAMATLRSFVTLGDRLIWKGTHDLSLALQCEAVRLMTKNPSLVDDAKLERWMEGGDPHTLVLWRKRRPILAARHWPRALAATEGGQQLRSASPQPTVLPEATRLSMLAQTQALRHART